MANSGKTLQTRIQLKHDTEANWKTAGNNGFKPLAGELIIYDEINLSSMLQKCESIRIFLLLLLNICFWLFSKFW